MFHSIRLTAAPDQMEELGSKPKFWFKYPGVDKKEFPEFDENGVFLFKADDRGTGEDWAEKISCELCALVGIPHVHYEMAFHGRPGVICQSCVPPAGILVLANQLLLALDPEYPVTSNKYKAEKHTVEAAVAVLRTLKPPSSEWCGDLPDGIESALDVFVGYLMLDAWVANQDRHHENWGAVFFSREMRLAPTFDHGAALARNLADGERKKRMETRDKGYAITAFARKAKSAFYSDASPEQTLTTHDAWREIAKHAPDAASIWLDKLRSVDEGRVQKTLSGVPEERLSTIGREFTARLLNENRSLLLAGL